MLSEVVNVTVFDETIEISKGTLLKEVAKNYQNKFKFPIILAKVNGRYKELSDPVNKDSTIEFLTINEKQANRTYMNGLLCLVMYAGKKVLKNNKLTVLHSLDKGIYIKCDKKISQDDVLKIKNEMKELVKLNISFEKYNINRLDAIDYFKSIGENSKASLLNYNTNTYITLYKLGNSYNYFFSYMPCETRCLDRFDLKYVDEFGFVLLYQTTYMLDDIKSYRHHEKMLEIFKLYHSWIELMDIPYVSALNKIVSSGNVADLIRITETLYSGVLLNTARTIYENQNKIKVILIAGPSSSGKTTTSKKLSMYLRCFGLNPKTLSMDNYFVEREDNPKDENGDYNFECLEAIDLDLFNNQINSLVNGETVELPEFDFILGRKNMNTKNYMTMKKNDILIVEGIHALNPIILDDIPRKNKYKIYIGPFTCLNLDEQNRISTSDNRLIRRIIRDNINRGYTVETTLEKWNSVRKGEEVNIFPFQDEADVLYNTGILYEMGVLKTYVEPLLYSVDKESPYYDEAKRLLNMLKMFLPIPSEEIPKDSILREFIGGSCF